MYIKRVKYMIVDKQTQVRNKFMGEWTSCERTHAHKQKGRTYLLPRCNRDQLLIVHNDQC